MSKLTIEQFRATLKEKTGRDLPPHMDALLTAIAGTGVEIDFEDLGAKIEKRHVAQMPKPATYSEVSALIRPMTLQVGDTVKWRPGFALDHDLMKEDTQAIVTAVFPPRVTDDGPMVDQTSVALAFVVDCKKDGCDEMHLIEVPFDGRRLMRVGDND